MCVYCTCTHFTTYPPSPDTSHTIPYYTQLRTPTYPYYVCLPLPHISHLTPYTNYAHIHTSHLTPYPNYAHTHTSHFTQYTYKHTHTPYVTPIPHTSHPYPIRHTHTPYVTPIPHTSHPTTTVKSHPIKKGFDTMSGNGTQKGSLSE